MEIDHDTRLRDYAALAGALAARCEALPGAGTACGSSRSTSGSSTSGQRGPRVGRGARAEDVETALAAGDPSVRAMLSGDALVFCTEALRAGELDEIAHALSTVWPQ